jgi:hypothetical protein
MDQTVESTTALDDLSSITGLPKSNIVDKSKPSGNGAADDLGSIAGVGQVRIKETSVATGKDPLSRSRSAVDLTNVYTDPIGNYVGYGVPLNPYADWNDIRAKNQGTLEKLGYGTLKLLTTGTGAVAENTLGVVAGLFSAAGIGGDSYADNFVGRAVDDTNEWMSKNLPHYYTNKELEPGREVSLNANFWTDKVANGLGYSLGSIATVWLTGGSGLLARGAGVGARAIMGAGEVLNAGKIISTGEKLKNIYQASKLIKTGTALTGDVAAYANAAKLLNATRHLEMGAMMSLGEASVEAREKSKMFTEEMYEAWEQQNPGKSAKDDMPEDVRKSINDSAKALENTTFGWNLAVLMPTNLLMFGKHIMGGKYGKPTLTNAIVNDGEKFVEATAKTAFGRTFRNANRFAKPIYENALTEAFQEGAQFMIGDVGNSYFRNKFDDGVADITQSVVEGLSNTFGTTEGLESMLLGAITGGMMGASSTISGAESQQRKQLKANTEKLLEIKNSGSFANMMASAEANVEQLKLIKNIQDANAVGNFKLAEELRMNLDAARASKLQSLGAMSLGLEELDDLGSLSEEEFMKRGGYDLTTPLKEQTGGKNHLELINEKKERLKEFAKLSDDIDSIITMMQPEKQGLGAMLMSKESKQEAAIQNLYNQRLKTVLLSSMVGIKSREKEIDASLKELQEISLNSSDALKKAFGNYDFNKLVALVKRNKVSVDENGNITMPPTLTDTKLSDAGMVAESEKTGPTFKTITKEGKAKEDIEFLQGLDKALEEAESLDPINRQKFKNAYTNLFNTIALREEALAAFDELVKSPEKRDLAIAAKQSIARQAELAKANKAAGFAISEARTSKELDDMVKGKYETLDPEVQAAVNKKYDELKKIESELKKDYIVLSLEELEDLAKNMDEIEEADPQKALALREVIADLKGETQEESEIANRAKNKADREAEDEAEEAANALRDSQEVDEESITTSYSNNIVLRSTNGRLLRVNGVNYENLEEDPLAAIDIDQEAMQLAAEDESISFIKSVKLTNELGQTVIFRAEENNTLVLELAEIIATSAASQGTINTAALSEVEVKNKVDAQIDALTQQAEAVEVTTDINLKTSSNTSIERAAKEYKTFIYNILSSYSFLKESYLRQQMSGEEFNKDPQVLALQKLLKDAKANYKKFVDALHSKTETPAETTPSTSVPAGITVDEEVNLEDLSGQAQAKLDDVNLEIKNLSNEINAIEGAVRNGIASDEDVNNLEELNRLLNAAEAQKEFIQEELTRINEEYESRKSSQASQDLQTPEGATEYTQEQGNQPETEGAVQAPEDGTVDVNETGLGEEEGLILTAEIISNADFIEGSEEDTEIPQITDSSNFIQDDEEEVEYPVVEDDNEEMSASVTAPVKENEGGAINARLVSSEYKYEEGGFDHIEVDDNGKPQSNPEYLRVAPTVINSVGKEVRLGIEQFNLASNELIPLNTTLEFELIGDSVWFQKEVASGRITPEDMWKSIPILVKAYQADGRVVRIGLLEGYKPGNVETNSSREEIYKNIISGKKVTSTVAGKRYNSNKGITNARTKAGEVYFYNPFIKREDGSKVVPTLAVATTVKGMLRWTIYRYGDNVAKGVEIDTTAWDISDRDLGKVAMVVEDPLGGYKHLRMTTKMMTTIGVQKVVTAINDQDFDRVNDIVGFNVRKEAAIGLENRDLLFHDIINRGDEQVSTYIFYVPSAESYIQISAQDLFLAFTGTSSFKYGFVTAERTEKGAIDFVNDTTRKDQKLFENDINKAFTSAILKRRYQVDVNRLGSDEPFTSPIDPTVTYATYLDYLGDEAAIPDIAEESLGHSGILSTDKVFNSKTGSPFFDVGITYGPMLVDGKALENPFTETPAKPAVITPIDKQLSQQEEEYVEDDDTNAEYDDVDLSNDLLNENELGNTIQPEEETLTPVEQEEEVEAPPAQNRNRNSIEELEKKAGLEEEEEVSAEVSDKNEGLSGKTSTVDADGEVTKDVLVNILDNIEKEEFKGMYKDPITGEETHYLIQTADDLAAKKFDRTTSRTSDPFNGPKEKQVASSKAGTSVHKVAEVYVQNPKLVKRPPGMKPVAFLDLMTQLRGMNKILTKNGGKVIAVEKVVYTSQYKLAGKFDILVKNKDNSYSIYDIKTGSEAGLEKYDVGYVDPETKIKSKSKRQQHGSQLSAYAYMLVGHGMENNTKVRISSGHVLYIPIAYDEVGNIQKVSTFAKKDFELSFKISEVLAGKVTFERKTTSTNSDPAIKNSGKKKASTTTEEKGKTVVKPAEDELEEEEATIVKNGKVKEGFVKGTVLGAGVKAAIMMDAIDAEGVVNLFKAEGKTITLAEAEKMIKEIQDQEKEHEETCNTD